MNATIKEGVQRIKDALDNKHGRMTFTVELGRGETYSSDKWTVYSHDNYPRHSVLHGRERRMWIAEFASQEEAIEACKAAGVWKRTDISGSTHVPIDQIVSHIPDDTDY